MLWYREESIDFCRSLPRWKWFVKIHVKSESSGRGIRGRAGRGLAYRSLWEIHINNTNVYSNEMCFPLTIVNSIIFKKCSVVVFSALTNWLLFGHQSTGMTGMTWLPASLICVTGAATALIAARQSRIARSGGRAAQVLDVLGDVLLAALQSVVIARVGRVLRARVLALYRSQGCAQTSEKQKHSLKHHNYCHSTINTIFAAFDCNRKRLSTSNRFTRKLYNYCTGEECLRSWEREYTQYQHFLLIHPFVWSALCLLIMTYDRTN